MYADLCAPSCHSSDMIRLQGKAYLLRLLDLFTENLQGLHKFHFLKPAVLPHSSPATNPEIWGILIWISIQLSVCRIHCPRRKCVFFVSNCTLLLSSFSAPHTLLPAVVTNIPFLHPVSSPSVFYRTVIVQSLLFSPLHTKGLLTILASSGFLYFISNFEFVIDFGH